MAKVIEQAQSQQATSPNPQPSNQYSSNIAPSSITDAQYLEERGWFETSAGWMDMNPPPDKVIEVARIQQQDNSTKVVSQVLVSNSGGWAMHVREALATEKRRNRSPLPKYSVAEDPRITCLTRFYVIDRQKQIAQEAGSFAERHEAESWVSAHN